MYELDEHEAFQAMAVYLRRYGREEGSMTMGDLLLLPSGYTADSSVWSIWLECVHDVTAATVRGKPVTAAPEAIVELSERLVAAGFVLVEDWDDKVPVGGGYAEWRRGDIRIRALCDALEWSLWISLATAEWFESIVWLAHFADELPAFAWPIDFAEMCRVTAARLGDFPLVVTDRAGLQKSLRHWRAKYYERTDALWRETNARGAAGPESEQ